MVNRLLVIIASIAVIGMLSVGCGSSGSAKSTAVGDKTAAAASEALQAPNAGAVTLITSTSQLPGASTQLLQLKLTEEGKAQADGMFDFQHYDSATLFKSSAEPGALLDGNIDIGFIQPGYFYDNGALWANMFDIAFLYTDVDNMMTVLDPEGDVGKWCEQQIWDQFHLKILSPYYLGRRDIWMSADKTVKTPADLKGVKIRMPNSASFLDMGKALGAEPTPLDSSETYLAMQTGTVDAQENIILSSYANTMQEVCKTIILTDHMITSNWICVNGDKWESMSSEQQEKLTAVVRAAAKANNDDVIAQEEKILDECVDKHGITLQEPDKDAFRNYALEYYLSNPDNEKNWNMDIFNDLNK